MDYGGSVNQDFLKRKIATLQWDLSMITDEEVIEKKQQELEEYKEMLHGSDDISDTHDAE